MVIGHLKSNLWLLFNAPGALAGAYRWSLLAAAVGTLLDGTTTWVNLSHWGAAAEMHPAISMVVHLLGVNLGVPVAMVAKFTCAVTVAAILRTWTRPILLATGAIGLFGAAFNILQHF